MRSGCQKFMVRHKSQLGERADRKKDLLQKQSEGQGAPAGRCMEVPDAAGFSKSASRMETEQAPGAS